MHSNKKQLIPEKTETTAFSGINFYIKKGMKIEYTTKYETKTYITDEIKEIEETDFSVLEPTKDNRITLITCIANQRAKRLCVIGIGE